MSNKNTTDLYVNVHGLSKLKNLNKELRNTADLLLGITEYAKYLKEAGADKQDFKLFVKNLVSNLTRETETEVAPRSPFFGMTFEGKAVSKEEYMAAYDDYVSRCSRKDWVKWI